MDFEKFDEGHAEGEEKLVFHYNREERIKNAPQNVQDYYSGRMKTGAPGLFRSLVATKTNRFIFVAIMIFAAVIFFHGFFGNKPYSKNVNGIPFELKVSGIENTVYVLLSAGNALAKYDYSAGNQFDGELFFLDSEGNVIDSQKINFNYSGQSVELRTKYNDYDIIRKVRAQIDIKSKVVVLEAPAERR